MHESCTSCHVMRKRLLRRAGNSWSVASSRFRSALSSSNAANLPQCTPCEDALTARALPNCWEPSCLSSPVVLCPALEDSLVNASNTSDLTGGATSVAISGSSSESNCVGVLNTLLATFLAEQPEKNLRVPLGGFPGHVWRWVLSPASASIHNSPHWTVVVST